MTKELGIQTPPFCLLSDSPVCLCSSPTPRTTGEFSTQRSNRLLEQLRQDPSILKAMREELVIILEEQLERKGIPQVRPDPESFLSPCEIGEILQHWFFLNLVVL